jgi:hypothetical protein
MLLWLHSQVASQQLLATELRGCCAMEHEHLLLRAALPAQQACLLGPCCLALLLWLPAGLHSQVASQ